MKKSRYNEEQIIRILRETDQDRISEVSIYAWQKRFGSTLMADDMKRLKMLASENTRLKKILAERDLEIEVMKGIAAKKW